MKRLNDENPYLILGITPLADRTAIRNAFAKRNSERLTGEQRRKIHQAYETLRSPEDRGVVDALVPMVDSSVDPQLLLLNVENALVPRQPLAGQLDLEAIWIHDYHNLIQATVKALCQPTTESFADPPHLSDFDALDEFVASFGE